MSLLLVMSCGGDRKNDAPDVSGIQEELTIIRYDQALQNIKSNDAEVRTKELFEKYPTFTPLYFKHILPLHGKGMDSLARSIVDFNNDTRIQTLYRKVDSVFRDFSPVEKDLAKALKYYKHYFPSQQSPRIYTFISEYAYQAIIFKDGDRDGIGLGLDMFLGSDFPYKSLDPKNPAFSGYLTRSFNSDHIGKKVVERIVDDRLGTVKGNRMLDIMIHNGKRLYIMDLLLPEKSDTIITEYSKKEWQWAQENEVGIYSFLLDNELFYETSPLKINKYVNPSPTSPGMPDDAPGRTANFIGWKIIEAYMKKHPKTTLEQLIAMDDAQKILEASRYKPKRKQG